MIKQINPRALMYCESRSEIVFHEKRAKYVAYNPSAKIVEAYQIDGVLIIEGMKCDNGLAIPIDNVIYLIELKGSDLCHACEQISATIIYLERNGLRYPFYARIVLSKASGPDLESIQYKKLSKQIRERGGNLKQKSVLMEENI